MHLYVEILMVLSSLMTLGLYAEWEVHVFRDTHFFLHSPLSGYAYMFLIPRSTFCFYSTFNPCLLGIELILRPEILLLNLKPKKAQIPVQLEVKKNVSTDRSFSICIDSSSHLKMWDHQNPYMSVSSKPLK